MSHPSDGRTVRVPVVPPFRLDLTVRALQRVPVNPVESWSAGRYLRAFDTPAGPVVWEVSQPAPPRGPLRLRLHGPVREAGPWTSLVRRMLGCDVDLRGFYAAAGAIPVVAGLAERLRGVKPPRFASLWESLVSAIAFQQLSLSSGMAALVRLARRCAEPVVFGGIELRPFPGALAVRRLSGSDLRACGFSTAKARSLREAAAAILDGALREDELERSSDDEAVARLRQVPGVGPWTASLVLLRGLRRLSSFPMADSGAERRLRAVFGDVDRDRLLEQLGPWRGMLYFHLLLAAG